MESSRAFSGTNPTLSGQITTVSAGGTDTLDLTGITLGVFTASGQTVTLKGDIVFTGVTPVPLPGSVWLLAAALCLLWHLHHRDGQRPVRRVLRCRRI